MEYEEPKLNQKEKKELAVIEVGLVFIAVIGIGIIVWVAWLRPASQAKATVNSFSECTGAGYPVQESYPEVCVTPDGRKFVHSD